MRHRLNFGNENRITNEEIFKRFKLRQMLRKLERAKIDASLKRGDTARKQVIPVRNVTRSEEIRPTNIPKFSFGLNRFLKGLFNF